MDPIPFANVYFKEAHQGAVSDANGFFEIPVLCQGSYHVSVSHIGCQTRELYMTVKHDTTLLLELEHHSQIMDELAVAASAIEEATTQEIMLMDAHEISQNAE